MAILPKSHGFWQPSHNLCIGILNLTVDDEIYTANKESSFDSSPDFSFDKGATAFLELVEGILCWVLPIGHLNYGSWCRWKGHPLIP